MLNIFSNVSTTVFSFSCHSNFSFMPSEGGRVLLFLLLIFWTLGSSRMLILSFSLLFLWKKIFLFNKNKKGEKSNNIMVRLELNNYLETLHSV